jgi:hypothetical protein
MPHSLRVPALLLAAGLIALPAVGAQNHASRATAAVGQWDGLLAQLGEFFSDLTGAVSQAPRHAAPGAATTRPPGQPRLQGDGGGIMDPNGH